MCRAINARVHAVRLVVFAGAVLSMASMAGLGPVSDGWRDEVSRRLAALPSLRLSRAMVLTRPLRMALLPRAGLSARRA